MSEKGVNLEARIGNGCFIGYITTLCQLDVIQLRMIKEWPYKIDVFLQELG
jgi:hypothetical protein